MKVILYCQHVLGVGHFFRSLAICRALAGHQVILVSGGPRVAADLPRHVRQVKLDELRMDGDFSGLSSPDPKRSLDQVKAARQKRLFTLFAQEAPDLFIVELYPFGRKAFRFELDPVLDAIREGRLPPCRVVCSLRDILVEKEDQQRHETRAVSVLNRCFDALLVHADSRLVRLEETFYQFAAIAVPVIYTGFIVKKPAAGARARIRRQLKIGADDILILASAGGGSVGRDLLEAVIRAFPNMQTPAQRRLQVFTGPFMRQRDFEHLRTLAGTGITVARFVEDFPSHLAAADLSVSMAGYNTCMDLLGSRVPALVCPFSQNGEQRLRAERLARLGLLAVLDQQDLSGHRLAAAMDQRLSRPPAPEPALDLDGAAHTAAWIKRWTQSPGRT